jgi:hypothetical protein
MLNIIDKVFRKKKYVIYTAIFGDYDSLKEPQSAVKGCDFVCFTDNPNMKSNIFKIQLCPPSEDPARQSRKYKMLPHRYLPEYEYSLWIDGSILIKKLDLKKLVQLYLSENDLALFAHPERDCIYEEVKACERLGKDNNDLMRQQIERYRKKGYPEHNGLIAAGFLLRRTNSPELVRLSEDWWCEVKNNSKRDQLSFNYLVWKKGLNYKIISGYLWENEYFSVLPHEQVIMS